MLRGEGKSATPTPNSGRYDFIQTQRYIRGEHASTSRGPSVDKFKCGSFFNTGDSRTARSDVVEDSTNLVVSSTSFRRHDWVCISCDIEHKVAATKEQISVEQRQEAIHYNRPEYAGSAALLSGTLPCHH
jgi:hypothetical protein